MQLEEFALFAGVEPEDAIAEGGLPAAALRGGSLDGMPAYADDPEKMVVMETLVCIDHLNVNGPGWPMLFPLSWRKVVLVSPRGELTPLYNFESKLRWRPKVYELRLDSTVPMNSQTEQEFRVAMFEIERNAYRDVRPALMYMRKLQDEFPDTWEDEWQKIEPEFVKLWAKRTPTKFEWAKANDRAEQLLLETLNPQQRLEWLRAGRFFVRGTINELYSLERHGGGRIHNTKTGWAEVALCIHPDRWIPAADTALACKLLIESGVDGEQEFLEAARPWHWRTPPDRPYARPPTVLRETWAMHRQLLPEQHTETIR